MNKLIFRVSLIAVLLGFVVVVLGAYTRLADAGLGCPDWPGCYGQLVVPQNQASLAQAAILYPDQPVVAAKAWKEMLHRYVAGSLGLLIFAIAFLAWRKRLEDNQPVLLALCLVPLVVFQAALGMWTVTLQLLPLVVMGHLLGGIALVSTLWWLTLSNSGWRLSNRLSSGWCMWALIALVICAVQIALGGWTSSNYAALACPDFPFCQGSWIPAMDLSNAFRFWSPLGINYEGGILDNAARATINTFHRFGGVVTATLVLYLALTMLFKQKARVLRTLAFALILVVLVQISLGILNITELLPLGVAVAHNAVAVILLLLLLTVNFLFTQVKEA